MAATLKRVERFTGTNQEIQVLILPNDAFRAVVDRFPQLNGLSGGQLISMILEEVVNNPVMAEEFSHVLTIRKDR